MPVTALKKSYPGVQLLAPAAIEANSLEQALRGAQYGLALLILFSFSSVCGEKPVFYINSLQTVSRLN
jgi:hypothetical protein